MGMGEVNKAQGEIEGAIKDAGFGKELEEAKASAKKSVKNVLKGKKGKKEDDDEEEDNEEDIGEEDNEEEAPEQTGGRKKIKGGGEDEETSDENTEESKEQNPSGSNTCDEFKEIVPTPFEEDISEQEKGNLDILIEEKTGQLPKNTPEEKLKVLQIKLGIESKGLDKPPEKLFYRIPSANNGEESSADGEEPAADGEEISAVGGKKRKTKKMKK